MLYHKFIKESKIIMKRTRSLSLLLTFIMAFSCLPVMASASSSPTVTNTPIGVNLFDEDILTNKNKWTGLAVTPVAVNDTYLFMGAVDACWQTTALTLDVSSANNGNGLANNTEYCLKLDARSPVDGTEVTNESYRVKAGATDQIFFNVSNTRTVYSPSTSVNKFKMNVSTNKLTMTIRGANNFYNIVPKEIYGLQIFDSTGTTLLYERDFSDGLKSGESWAGETVSVGTYLRVDAATAAGQSAVHTLNNEIVLTPGNYELTFDARQSYFFNNSDHNAELYAASNAKGVQESVLDTDGKRNNSQANNTEDPLKKDTAPTDWCTNSNAYPTTTSTRYHILYKRDVIVNTKQTADSTAVAGYTKYLGYSEDYKKHIHAKVDGNGSYVYMFDAGRGVAHANYRDVKLTLNTTGNLKVNGANFTGDTFNVTTNWDSYKYTFTVPEGQTVKLNSISFGGTDKAYDNDAFDISKLSLKLVSPFTQTVVTTDTENFLNNATEDYNDGIYSETKASSDGYLSIDRRPWYWNGNEGYISGIKLFDLEVKLKDDVASDERYFIKFDIRHQVPTNDRQFLQIKNGTNVWKVLGTDGNYTRVHDESDAWDRDITFYTDTPGTGKKLTIMLRREADERDIPVDIDNIIIWKEPKASANGIYGETTNNNDTLIYSKDFNGTNSSLTDETGKFSIAQFGYNAQTNPNNHTISVGSDENSGRLTAATPVLTYKNLNNGKGHPEGIYTFSADFRIPYFIFASIKNANYSSNYALDIHEKITEASADKLAEFYAYNQHKVKVTFKMTTTDGTPLEPTTVTVNTDFSWNSVNTSVIVPKDALLTGIDIEPVYNSGITVPADKKALDFKNVRLYYADFPTVETDDSNNYLDDTTVYVDNAVPTAVNFDAPYGYITVAERPNENSDANPYNLFNIATDFKVEKNTKYVIELDIIVGKCGADEMRFRPTLNVGTNDTGINNNYLNKTSGSDFSFNNDGGQGTFVTTNDGSDQVQKLRGEFTTTASGSSNALVLALNKGKGTGHNGALVVDNFNIYKKVGNTETLVYSNSFDTQEELSRVTANNPYLGTFYNFSHTLYTPIDDTKPMNITYDVQLTDEEKVEGKYAFKALAKLAADPTAPAKALVIFNYSDGSKETNYIDLTTDWTYIGISGRLNRTPTLVNVEITFISDVPVMLADPSLGITYRWQYGKPNSGIAMVLLKKLQGGMTDPWKQIGLKGDKPKSEPYNFVTNSGFDSEPVISASQLNYKWASAPAGEWSYSQSQIEANASTKLSYGEYKGEKCLTVVSANATPSISHSPDVTLDAGTYTLSIDIFVEGTGTRSFNFDVFEISTGNAIRTTQGAAIVNRTAKAGEWSNIEVPFTLASSGKVVFRFWSGEARTIHIDNVSITSPNA